ncbi:MAG: rhodanese-like domain-containing protein [Alphaproteobacteria bacterium]|nr:rhodanese-like domain-containing protein [Alphaproteobacteria bacterium]
MSWFSSLLGGAATSCRCDGPTARALVADGAQLVDVRTAAEFGSGHLQGALNIPVSELSRRLGEVPRDRDVVVYCRSGGRSAQAAVILQGAGLTAVHDLGPLTAW